MQVTKRNGELTDFNVSKIKKVVSWACENLDVNPLELEASFNQLFSNGMSTRDIQKVLIVEAAARTSLQDPDWRYVAGRLHMMNIWKDTVVSRGIPKYGDEEYSFCEVVGYQVDRNRYDDAIYFHYSSEELNNYGKLIKANYDLDLDYAASVSFAKRYLVKEELPQEALLMAALWIATREKPENRPLYVEKFYRAFAERRISLATPILINLRRPNVNLSSCFILSASNSLESLINAITDVGTISQSGGGVGVNLSHVSAVAQKNPQILSYKDLNKLSAISIQDSLVSIMENATTTVAAYFKKQQSLTFNLSEIRAKGSSIQNIPGLSGGVIPWVMIIDTFANSVTKSRNSKPILNIVLEDWHLDIEDFLTLGNTTGDQRRRVQYAVPQVVVSDELRWAAEEGKDWILGDPYELNGSLGTTYQEELQDLFAAGALQNFKVVKAKSLLERIEKAFEQPEQHPSINRWAQAINSVAVGVNQLGKRSGAVTVSLDSWHLGIEEFIEIQSEKGNATEKAFDIFPQVVCSDWFMTAAQNGEDWLLVDPAEVLDVLGIDLPKLWGEQFNNAYANIWENKEKLTHHKIVGAKQLYIQMMRAQVETGMPYQAFKDTMNRANPNKYEGYIPAGNLCMETYSNVAPDKESHVCNILSLNNANITEETLEDSCRLAVRILDNAIDLTSPPTETTRIHNQKYRTIGVGQMGLADFFAKNEFMYGGQESIELASKRSEDIAYFCFDESTELAAERGAFGAYSTSEWAKGKILCHDIEWFEENAYEVDRWYKLQERIKKHGIRNSQLLAIAPNTSSSLVQGCTASILPVYSKLFYDKGSNGSLPICPPFIKEKFWFYPEAKTVDPNKVVAVTAAIQKWTDTGISMELMFDMNNPEHNPKFIFNTMMNAWRSGCKTIYYIRSVQKATESENECSVCKN